MDPFSDEVCCSAVSTTPGSWVTQGDRQTAITRLKVALKKRGTALEESQQLWIASEFEADLNKKSGCLSSRYQALLEEKLSEICSNSGSRAVAAGCVKVREPGCGDLAHDGSFACKGDAPTIGAAFGHGIEDAVWDKINTMQARYFIPLQSCYVALVAALRQSDLPGKEEESLKAFKRLTLGLVLFLSAPRHRIPGRFNLEKLSRLEVEIIQIFACMLHKFAAGIICFAPEMSKKMESVFLAARCKVREMQRRGRPQAGNPGVLAVHPTGPGSNAIPLLMEAHSSEESSADSASVFDQVNSLEGNELSGFPARIASGQGSSLGKHGRNVDVRKGSAVPSHLGQQEKRPRTVKHAGAVYPGSGGPVVMNHEDVDSECSVV